MPENQIERYEILCPSGKYVTVRTCAGIVGAVGVKRPQWEVKENGVHIVWPHAKPEHRYEVRKIHYGLA